MLNSSTPELPYWVFFPAFIRIADLIAKGIEPTAAAETEVCARCAKAIGIMAIPYGMELAREMTHWERRELKAEMSKRLQEKIIPHGDPRGLSRNYADDKIMPEGSRGRDPLGISQDRIDDLAQLVTDGMSVRRAAETVGISSATAHKYVTGKGEKKVIG